MISIAHIINPVKVEPDTELGKQQPITFKTMITARDFALRDVYVEQHVTGYPEDHEIYPNWMVEDRDLDRTIQDVKEISPFKRLPLFSDMLDRLYENTACDYMMQTNADICLMPHFYTTVARLIEKGFDSIIINKRIIPGHYNSVDQIPEMYCELGSNHNGFDCFIFRKELYPKFKLGDICMGIPWSETTLAASMAAYSDNCTVIKVPHLTFHIGDSRTWMMLHNYRRHNTEEFAKTLLEIAKDVPDIMNHKIIQWQLFKLRGEMNPLIMLGIDNHYSKECYELAMTMTDPTKAQQNYLRDAGKEMYGAHP